MRTFGVPEVLLLVLTQYLPPIVDEISDIVEIVTMLLDDGAGYDADVEFLGESAVGVEVRLGLSAEVDEIWIVGEPVGEVVFRENGEVNAL